MKGGERVGARSHLIELELAVCVAGRRSHDAGAATHADEGTVERRRMNAVERDAVDGRDGGLRGERAGEEENAGREHVEARHDVDQSDVYGSQFFVQTSTIAPPGPQRSFPVGL